MEKIKRVWKHTKNKKSRIIGMTGLLLIIILVHVAMNQYKAKASGYDTIDGIIWNFDIEDGKAVGLYAPYDIDTSEVVIPTEVTYKGSCYPVASVGTVGDINNSGFFKGELIANTKVTFAKKDGITSITTIQPYAFCGCNAIQSVELPDSLTEIGKYAFYNCSDMTTVTGVENVTILGDSAFEKCSFLTDITLNKITTFGSKLFDGCNSLRLTITNPNLDLSRQNFKPARLIGFKNSTTREYYEKNNLDDDNWRSLDQTTINGKTYPKSFKVTISTKEDATLTAGLFQDFYYGLAGESLPKLSACATKTYYQLDGYYFGTECYYAYDKDHNNMVAQRDVFPTDYTENALALEAEFMPEIYDIEYHLNQGSWKKDAPVDLVNTNKEQYIYSVGKILNDQLERKGYLFDGWYEEQAGAIRFIDRLTKTDHGKKVFWAKWSPIHFSIHFNGNEEQAGYMPDQNVVYDNKTVLNQNTFRKNGYSFTGWNTKADGSGIAYKDSADITNLIDQDGICITLYAQWAADTKITFDGNGKDAGLMTNQTIPYNNSSKLFKNKYSKTGYLFVGWNTKKDGSGVSYQDEALVKNLVTNDNPYIILYAQWKAGTDTEYTVIYTKEGIPSQKDSRMRYRIYKGTSDTQVTPDASIEAEDGFITPENQTITIKADGSTTVEYIFQRKQYHIYTKYDTEKVKKVNGPEMAFYEQKVDLSFEVHEGYQANGFLREEHTIYPTKNTDTEIGFTMSAHDVILHATAVPAQYSISYELNNGKNTGSSVTKYTYGDTIALPDADTMSLPGFVFGGWYTKESFEGEPVTHILPTTLGNKTYWAKWIPGGYHIAFDTQGGTIVDGNVTEYRFYTGATLPTKVVKEGYSFLGWWDGSKIVSEIKKTEYGDKLFTALWSDNRSAAYTYVDGDTVNLYDTKIAKAMTESIDAKKTGYYYTKLSANARKAYATLYQNYYFISSEHKFKKTDALFFASDIELSKKDLLDAQMAFVYDHPAMFFVTYFARSEVNNVSGTDTDKHYYMYSPVYAYSPNLYNGDAEAYEGYFKKAVKAMRIGKKDTSYDKLKKIHDYLIANYSYDDIGYKMNERSSNDTRSIGRMLAMKSGCCVGYAKLTKAFCDYYAIPCIIVSGVDHMWNQVCLNGKWYGLDVTWDRANGKKNKSNLAKSYRYFLKGKKVFLEEKEHHVINSMFQQNGKAITEYACLQAPALGNDYQANKDLIKKDQILKKGIRYKIINKKKKQVSVIGVVNKTITQAQIAKTIRIHNITYQVIAIHKNAFAECTRLKQLKIASSYMKIESNAWKGCKRLKKITIRSAMIRFSKNALKGIAKNAVFYVPAKKIKRYQKMIGSAKTGYKKTMKVKKL